MKRVLALGDQPNRIAAMAISIVLSTLWLAYPVEVAADTSGHRFRVLDVASDDPEVRTLCETLAADLNSFPTSTSMICERKHNPKFQRLDKPVWREWPVEEIGQRFYLIKDYYAKHRQPPRELDQATLDRILGEAKHGDFRVQEATIPTRTFGPRRWIRWGNPSLEKARAERQSLGVKESDISLTYSDDCSWGAYVTLTPDGRALMPSTPGGVVASGSGTLDIWIWLDPDGVRDSFYEAWTNVSRGFVRAELSVDTNLCKIAYRRP